MKPNSTTPPEAENAGDAAPRGRLPAGRHGLSRRQVVASQQQRLIDAMAAVCSEKTYPATTVADVVDYAGVSRATFYQLFEDKQACFLATLDEAIGMLMEAIVPVVNAPSDEWAETVRRVIVALLDLLATAPEYAKTALVESFAAGERAFDRYSEAMNTMVKLLDEGRNHAVTDAELPPRLARAILGGGEWLIRGEMMADRTRRVPALGPDFLYMALVPFLGQEEALRQARLAASATG